MFETKSESLALWCDVCRAEPPLDGFTRCRNCEQITPKVILQSKINDIKEDYLMKKSIIEEKNKEELIFENCLYGLAKWNNIEVDALEFGIRENPDILDDMCAIVLAEARMSIRNNKADYDLYLYYSNAEKLHFVIMSLPLCLLFLPLIFDFSLDSEGRKWFMAYLAVFSFPFGIYLLLKFRNSWIKKYGEAYSEYEKAEDIQNKITEYLKHKEDKKLKS